MARPVSEWSYAEPSDGFLGKMFSKRLESCHVILHAGGIHLAVGTFEHHEQSTAGSVAQVLFTAVKQATVVKNRAAPPDNSGDLVELARIRTFRQSPAVARNQ